LEDTPISLPASQPPLNLYRVDYYHPNIGNDYAFAPGRNEEEAYKHFRLTHEPEFHMLSIALDYKTGE